MTRSTNARASALALPGRVAPSRGRLTRDDSLSVGLSASAPGGARECRLFHADNLAAMAEVSRTDGAVFRLAYLDPPFNTGRTFSEYLDAKTREEWTAMMEPRLRAVRELLREDGALAVEIDDTELGPLQLLCDAVFGAKNRVSTITVVRSAATGHKAQNRGPVHVTDFVLLYAKDKSRFSPNAIYRARSGPGNGIDPAYRTFVENRHDDLRTWRYLPLSRAAARASGHASPRAALAALGLAWSGVVARFALDNAASVARFAQVRFEAVSREAQRLVVASRLAPHETFRLDRDGRPPLLLRGGNRVLFLSSKLRSLRPDGTLDPSGESPRTIAEPLTNVWDDVPFQGIAGEGGVVFARNKKPERLLERIVALTTDPGDWVLDPFLGSGTTAAVAETMGRRWVGIEQGDHALSLALPRLTRLVRGEDATGLRRTRAYAGGGSFGVYR